VTARATVAGDDRIRLFLALEVPEDVSTALARWGRRHLKRGRVPESFHVTLAFLGTQPRSALAPITELLCSEAAATEPFELGVVRYRETRSVGMLVFADEDGRATRIAEDANRRLAELGVYEPERRPWLPHLTVVRFRERPRLRPPIPDLGPVTMSDAAVYMSRLRPTGAQYEVVESVPLGGG
jgi:RNA 2',3'-cyclic 3'-phosphodiesterase